MKIFKNIKSERGQATLIGVTLYVIGIVCERLGYLTGGLKWISFLFLLGALIYNIALYLKWTELESRTLKIAKVTLFFIITCLVIIFMTWFNKMYVTFAFTIIFAAVFAFFFCFVLGDICSMFKDLDEGE